MSRFSSTHAVVSPSLLVSIAATPWLAAIVSIQAASGLLEQLGLASEEMFRGDRLPILHFPHPVSETAPGEIESQIDISKRYSANLDELAGTLATAQERARKVAQNQIFRQEIEAARSASEKGKAKSVKLTESIDAIDVLKKKKMEFQNQHPY